MTNGDRPNGQLLTGAIGSFMNGAAYLIFLTGVAALTGLVMGGHRPDVGVGEGRALGGILLLAVFLLLAGGITGGIGWLGFGKVRGGTNALAGTFSLLTAAFIVLSVVSGIIGIEILAKISAYGLFGSIGLTGLLGGLGLMAGEESGGLSKVGGIIMLIGGIATLALLLFIIIGVESATIAELSYYGLYACTGGLAAGHILAGVSMLGARG